MKARKILTGVTLLICLGSGCKVSQAMELSEWSIPKTGEVRPSLEESRPDPLETEPHPALRPAMDCPQDIETLTALMVRDIPGYTNRVLQRHLGVVRQDIGSNPLNRYRPAYVVIASRPETEPLAVKDQVYTTSVAAGEPLQQVFFTTLERQYSRFSTMAEVLHFHWVFLVPDETGWYLTFMFSTADNPDTKTPILPPYESSQGSVGQAVQLWLRDCRAGAIAPLE